MFFEDFRRFLAQHFPAVDFDLHLLSQVPLPPSLPPQFDHASGQYVVYIGGRLLPALAAGGDMAVTRAGGADAAPGAANNGGGVARGARAERERRVPALRVRLHAAVRGRSGCWR